jgi:hypothetical protein
MDILETNICEGEDELLNLKVTQKDIYSELELRRQKIKQKEKLMNEMVKSGVVIRKGRQAKFESRLCATVNKRSVSTRAYELMAKSPIK